ncbi:Prostate stem cell antigen [Plecturocebus cupreus]
MAAAGHPGRGVKFVPSKGLSEHTACVLQKGPDPAAGLALCPAEMRPAGPGQGPLRGCCGAASEASPARPAGSALLCYTCRAQVSNEDCLQVHNCTASEKHCWTERIRECGARAPGLGLCHRTVRPSGHLPTPTRCFPPICPPPVPRLSPTYHPASVLQPPPPAALLHLPLHRLSVPYPCAGWLTHTISGAQRGTPELQAGWGQEEAWAGQAGEHAGQRQPRVCCSPGAIGLLTVISKGCSSHCEDDSQDYYLGKKNITCCDTDLCNASGARALQPAAATLALLTALGLLLWGPSQL